jgi:hypothetical protein
VIEWCFDQHIKNIYARLAESRVSVRGERGLKTGSKQQKIKKITWCMTIYHTEYNVDRVWTLVYTARCPSLWIMAEELCVNRGN